MTSTTMFRLDVGPALAGLPAVSSPTISTISTQPDVTHPTTNLSATPSPVPAAAKATATATNAANEDNIPPRLAALQQKARIAAQEKHARQKELKRLQTPPSSALSSRTTTAGNTSTSSTPMAMTSATTTTTTCSTPTSASVSKRPKKQLTKRQKSSKRSAEICRIKSHIYTALLEQAVCDEERAQRDLHEAWLRQMEDNMALQTRIAEMQGRAMIAGVAVGGVTGGDDDGSGVLSSSTTTPSSAAVANGINTAATRLYDDTHPVHDAALALAMGPACSQDFASSFADVDAFAHAEATAFEPTVNTTIQMASGGGGSGHAVVKKEEDEECYYMRDWVLNEPETQHQQQQQCRQDVGATDANTTVFSPGSAVSCDPDDVPAAEIEHADLAENVFLRR